MHENDENQESFQDMVRSIAREVSDQLERAMNQVDLDDVAGTFGLDPTQARNWVDNAGGWLRARVEGLGEEVAAQAAGQRGPRPADSERAGDRSRVGEDPLRGAAPHPLDIPTEEQGVALAALDSGRWTVEPGTNALATQGEGPGPSDALGLVRELHVRDWIAADGEVTLVGRHALSRWLDAAARG